MTKKHRVKILKGDINLNDSLEKKATGFQLFCWCLYDWANSAFATVVVTFVFSTYFVRSVADQVNIGTAYWGWMMGASGIVVAIFSPIFGSIADYTGRRKPWLGFFTLLNILSTAALFFVLPEKSWIMPALALLFIANITYEYGQVFYNALMTFIAPKEKIGRISGWGWSFGYFGGLICLALALIIFVNNNSFDLKNDFNIRLSNLLVAAWFLIFSLPLFIFTPDKKLVKVKPKEAIQKGLSELANTFRQVKKYKNIMKFLIAHLLYIDGLSTLFVFAGIYAAGTFNLSYSQILIYAMALNISAGLGALLFSWVDDWIGPKFTVSFSLVMIILSGICILIIKSVMWYWILSAFLGLFVGPTQAASRSYMARLSPPNLVSQMFGIYQLSGRITTFMGPLLVGTLTKWFSSQRVGLSVVFVLMFAGYLVLLSVPKPDEKSTH